MNKLFRASSRGFTLIEILVATAILAMVGMAVVVAEKQYMSSATTNKHKLQAIGLAQEGIEAVQAAFDKNLLANIDEPLKLLPGDATPDPNKVYKVDASGALSEVLNCKVTDTKCGDQLPLQDNTTFTRRIIFPKAP